jgi:hypothetical protein
MSEYCHEVRRTNGIVGISHNRVQEGAASGSLVSLVEFARAVPVFPSGKDQVSESGRLVRISPGRTGTFYAAAQIKPPEGENLERVAARDLADFVQQGVKLWGTVIAEHGLLLAGIELNTQERSLEVTSKEELAMSSEGDPTTPIATAEEQAALCEMQGLIIGGIFRMQLSGQSDWQHRLG